jgi:hypothetical protein
MGCSLARGWAERASGLRTRPNPESSCLSASAPRTAAPSAGEERLGDAVLARSWARRTPHRTPNEVRSSHRVSKAMRLFQEQAKSGKSGDEPASGQVQGPLQKGSTDGGGDALEMSGEGVAQLHGGAEGQGGAEMQGRADLGAYIEETRRLCGSLSHMLQKDAQAVHMAFHHTSGDVGKSNRSTVGLMITRTQIDSILPGGPAQGSDISKGNHQQPVAAYNRVGYCSNFQLNR